MGRLFRKSSPSFCSRRSPRYLGVSGALRCATWPWATGSSRVNASTAGSTPSPRAGRTTAPPVPWLPLRVGVVASLAFAALLAWSCSKPTATCDALAAAARGNLDVRIAATTAARRDELGDLGHDFDRIAAQLKALVEDRTACSTTCRTSSARRSRACMQRKDWRASSREACPHARPDQREIRAHGCAGRRAADVVPSHRWAGPAGGACRRRGARQAEQRWPTPGSRQGRAAAMSCSAPPVPPWYSGARTCCTGQWRMSCAMRFAMRRRVPKCACTCRWMPRGGAWSWPSSTPVRRSGGESRGDLRAIRARPRQRRRARSRPSDRAASCSGTKGAFTPPTYRVAVCAWKSRFRSRTLPAGVQRRPPGRRAAPSRRRPFFTRIYAPLTALNGAARESGAICARNPRKQRA